MCVKASLLLCALHTRVLLVAVIPAIIVAIALSVTRTRGYTSQNAYVQLSI